MEKCKKLKKKTNEGGSRFVSKGKTFGYKLVKKITLAKVLHRSLLGETF